LLIATGLRDKIPPVRVIDNFFGKPIFHCPYCDGWEVKDKLIGVYAKNKSGLELAVSLKTLSKKLVLYTDGRNYLTPVEKEVLQKNQIPVISNGFRLLMGKMKSS